MVPSGRCPLPGARYPARIYGAFQVHAVYRAPLHQATITSDTPALIQAILNDARTDADTA